MLLLINNNKLILFSHLSNLLLITLSSLQSLFKSNAGSLVFSYPNGLLSEIKPRPSSLSPKHISDASFASLWRPIFRSAESLKKGNQIFNEIDQLLYIGLINLGLNLLNLGVLPKISVKKNEKTQGEYQVQGYNGNSLINWEKIICEGINKAPIYLLAVSKLTKIRRLLVKERNEKIEFLKLADRTGFEGKTDSLQRLFIHTKGFTRLLNYEQTQEIVKVISSLTRIACKRGENWSNFAESNSVIIEILMESFNVGMNELIENGMNLLALYFAPIKEEKSNKILLDKIKSLDKKFIKKWPTNADKLIENLLKNVFLESNSSRMRQNALKLLVALWIAGEEKEREFLLENLSQMTENLINYGKNTSEFFNFVGFLCSYTDSSNEKINGILGNILKTLKNQLSMVIDSIVTHRNNDLYQFLAEILAEYNESSQKYSEINYFFEFNGCLKCYEILNLPFTDFKLTEITDPKNNNGSSLASGGLEYKFDSFKFSEKKLRFNENVKFTVIINYL